MRRERDHVRMRPLLGLLALVGCNGGLATDAAIADAPGPDAAQGLHVKWSFEKDGVAATCADVGAVMVRVLLSPNDDGPAAFFACEDGEGVVFPPVGRDYLPVAGLDATGNAFVVKGLSLLPGQLEATAVLKVLDEPRRQVAAMAASAKAYYEMTGTLPSSPFTTPVLGTCCGSACQICEPDPLLWSNSPGWTSIGFSVDTDSRYMYTLATSGTDMSFTARANGDLDCDATYSTFHIVGTVDAMGVVQLQPLTIDNEFE